jgi:hypothetical protein
LNLQHASVVVNMDLPWNPAVLEQRIGRVHRLGQRQPVRVVNFVAQGTIEEGMLGVLQFKKSLFAGVLDGGEKEVFLGGSRLTKFMETVEKTTTAIPASVVEDASDGSRFPAEGAAELAGEEPVQAPQTRAPAAASADPWAGLLQTGVALLEQLAVASHRSGSAAQASGGTRDKPGLAFLARDEKTGEPYVKLPVPSPEVLDRALQAFGALLAQFRK